MSSSFLFCNRGGIFSWTISVIGKKFNHKVKFFQHLFSWWSCWRDWRKKIISYRQIGLKTDSVISLSTTVLLRQLSDNLLVTTEQARLLILVLVDCTNLWTNQKKRWKVPSRSVLTLCWQGSQEKRLCFQDQDYQELGPSRPCWDPQDQVLLIRRRAAVATVPGRSEDGAARGREQRHPGFTRRYSGRTVPGERVPRACTGPCWPRAAPSSRGRGCSTCITPRGTQRSPRAARPLTPWPRRGSSPAIPCTTTRGTRTRGPQARPATRPRRSRCWPAVRSTSRTSRPCRRRRCTECPSSGWPGPACSSTGLQTLQVRRLFSRFLCPSFQDSVFFVYFVCLFFFFFAIPHQEKKKANTIIFWICFLNIFFCTCQK